MSMMQLKVILIFFTTVILTSCINEPRMFGKAASTVSVAEIRDATTVEKTVFDSKAKIRGESSRMYVWAEGGLEWLLRSWVEEGAVPSHQLYVDIDYTGEGWRFYRTAETTEAQSVQLTDINSDVSCSLNGCHYYETVGVNISHDFLLSRRDTGFTIRLSSKSGHSFVVTIPGNYTKGYIQSLVDPMKQAGLDVSELSSNTNQHTNIVLTTSKKNSAAPKLPENQRDAKSLASLCNMATKKGSNGHLIWDDGKAYESTVAMLREAHVDCGVSNYPLASDDDVCDMAVSIGGDESRQWGVSIDSLKYKKEAQNRGLDCGVTAGETETVEVEGANYLVCENKAKELHKNKSFFTLREGSVVEDLIEIKHDTSTQGSTQTIKPQVQISQERGLYIAKTSDELSFSVSSIAWFLNRETLAATTCDTDDCGSIVDVGQCEIFGKKAFESAKRDYIRHMLARQPKLTTKIKKNKI